MTIEKNNAHLLQCLLDIATAHAAATSPSLQGSITMQVSPETIIQLVERIRELEEERERTFVAAALVQEAVNLLGGNASTPPQASVYHVNGEGYAFDDETTGLGLTGFETKADANIFLRLSRYLKKFS